MRIRITESALGDLADINEYYAEEGVPEVGVRLVGEVIAHIERLADHPDIGREVPEFEESSIRELIHPPFRIVYLRREMSCHVVRVWRSERLLRLPDR